MAIPLLIGLGIAGAAGVGSAIANAVGSSNASAAQKEQAEQAMAFQRYIADQQQRNFNQVRQDQMPWLQAGQQTLGQLMAQMRGGGFDQRFDPSQLANDPGFQFRMQQGQQALERSASARGMLNSGATLKSLSRYSQGLASDEYQNAWNRNQAENSGRFNRLASLAGVGQTAAQSLGGLGGQFNSQLGAYGNSMGELYGAMGNANAAGAMGTAGAVGGGFGTLGNLATLGSLYSSYYGSGGGGGGGGGGIPAQSTGYAGGYAPANGHFGFGLNTRGW